MNYHRLGSYTTFDCPTRKLGVALAWLQTEFKKIGGNVRLIKNQHDFGAYPSFEIDYPEHLELVNEDDYLEDKELAQEKVDWHEDANEIEEEYNKKFSNYL